MIDAALLLPKILARAGDNANLSEMAAKVAWRRAAGDGLRDHAVPFRLRDKTLIVAVADAVWQKQLQTMSAELIFRVNKLLRRNVVEAIEFRINPRALRGRLKQHSADRQVAAPLPANVSSSAATIDDPELRQRFIRAAANCIERRESVGTGKSAFRNPKSAI